MQRKFHVHLNWKQGTDQIYCFEGATITKGISMQALPFIQGR